VTSLVFLHGLGGGHAAWDPQVAHFSRLGFPCTAWDQPGYGTSPMVEPYTLENIVSVLKDLVGADPVVLVGHSMGGFIAQESYARHPELARALALCFTSPAFMGGNDFARRFIAERIGPLDEGNTMAEVAARVMPAMRGRNSDPQGLAQAERIMSAVPPDTYRKAVRLLTSFDRRDNLARIAVPTLLVAGADDQTAHPAIMQKMAEKIPDAEYVVLEGCGHLGPMDQPEAFNAALESFLRRL
jgi:3-oxoadipate enol-lactonase